MATSPDVVAHEQPAPVACEAARRLHIGGHEAREGWTLVNIQPAPGVDVVGDCRDLSMFASASFDEVYASHVYEHLGYHHELPEALAEAHRVLRPGGRLRVSVPDLAMLCALFLAPNLDLPTRFYVSRMIYGGQMNAYDFHKVGLDFAILEAFLTEAGFVNVQRVETHGIFEDTSDLVVLGHPISLNVVAERPG